MALDCMVMETRIRRPAALLLLGWVMLLLGGCSSLLFHPQRELLPNPVAARFTPQDVFFPSGDGETLHGWFFSAPTAKGTILAFHGNAENISTHVNGVLWLVPAGFNLFIIDYRGYGLSTGTPSLDGVHRDGLAALERLLALPGVEQGRVTLLGQSLGGSVATYVAAASPQRATLQALVLDSAFFGYRQIAREKLGSFFLTWPFQYPLSWLFNDEYNAGRWLGRVTVPVIIIHDRDDLTVPFHHAEELRAAVSGPSELLVTTGNGHIGSFANAQVRSRLERLLSRSVPR
ncbi:MAG TPA: alpha/beta hydrolase [Geobacteraceae bacterium]